MDLVALTSAVFAADLADEEMDAEADAGTRALASGSAACDAGDAKRGAGSPSAARHPLIEYLAGCEPLPREERELANRRPSVETRIWREGDVGWVADIIEAAWSRWLLAYADEWRTVGQAVPYVHLRSKPMCDRPRTPHAEQREEFEIEIQGENYDAALDEWERGGRVGPEPRWRPHSLGHTHAHDHGICLDPGLVEDAPQGMLEDTLRHELAHAIAGDFGHGEDWWHMCQIIGYEPSPAERRSDDSEATVVGAGSPDSWGPSTPRGRHKAPRSSTTPAGDGRSRSGCSPATRRVRPRRGGPVGQLPEAAAHVVLDRSVEAADGRATACRRRLSPRSNSRTTEV